MKQWGFDGIICTDAGALGNMMRASHTYETIRRAAAAAIHAGINQFLENATPSVQDALKQGLITEADIDANLRGVFRVMIKLGMLDRRRAILRAHRHEAQANGAWTTPGSGRRTSAGAQSDGRVHRFAEERGQTLPLKAASIKSIAVIGPLADKVRSICTAERRRSRSLRSKGFARASAGRVAVTTSVARTPRLQRNWRARPTLPSSSSATIQHARGLGQVSSAQRRPGGHGSQDADAGAGGLRRPCWPRIRRPSSCCRRASPSRPHGPKRTCQRS